MENDIFELPPMIMFSEFGGDFSRFQEVVYQIFVRDFITHKSIFQGKLIALKKYPLVDDREYTFYHLTHDGKNEDERTPNINRYERIPWPRPLIENSNHKYLKVWRNNRKNKNRILIFHEDESYLVVLEDRSQYILLWTAYLVDNNHQKRKLLNEYNDYKKTETAR